MQWFNYPKNIILETVEVQNSKDFLSCSVGIHFWDYWNLSSVFKITSDKKNINTADVAKILTILRFVRPCSKSFTTELYSDTCLPEITKVPHSSYNKARVFRELEVVKNYKIVLVDRLLNFELHFFETNL